MAKAGTIKWNRSAFEEIRRTPEVNRVLEEEVKRVLGEVDDFSGEHYAGGVEDGATRSRGYVVTTSGEAIAAEAEDHTLLRALTAGGGLL